jgi:hypothetical protein
MLPGPSARKRGTSARGGHHRRARYRRTPDRGALELDFLNPHFLMRNVVLGLAYRDYTDGRRTEWLVGRPFRETVAPWALQTYGEDSRERMLVFREGLLASTARRYRTVVGLRGGFALTATPRDVVRVWGDLLWRREDYAADSAGAIPDRSVFVSAGASWRHPRALAIVELVDSYARTEDIDVRVRVGSGPLRPGLPGDRGAGPWPPTLMPLLCPASVGQVWLRPGSTPADRSQHAASQNLARQTIILHAKPVRRNAPHRAANTTCGTPGGGRACSAPTCSPGRAARGSSSRIASSSRMTGSASWAWASRRSPSGAGPGIRGTRDAPVATPVSPFVSAPPDPRGRALWRSREVGVSAAAGTTLGARYPHRSFADLAP